MLEVWQTWEGGVAAAPLLPAPSEVGEAPVTGTGKTSNSHHPNPRSIWVTGRPSGTGWLKQKNDQMHLDCEVLLHSTLAGAVLGFHVTINFQYLVQLSGQEASVPLRESCAAGTASLVIS